MPKTVRRSPLSVSTKSSDYPAGRIFNHVDFRGIQNVNNELIVDQTSFSDAQNVYIDREYNLVSRPALKFLGKEGHIRTWKFGTHTVEYRQKYARRVSEYVSPGGETDLPGYVVGMPFGNKSNYTYSSREVSGFLVKESHIHENAFGTVYSTRPGDERFYYVIENDRVFLVDRMRMIYEFYIDGLCVIQKDYNTFCTFDSVPDANCALIGDKIFIWFAGTDLYCYDTSTKTLIDIDDCIYVPIHKQVVNGFESNLETKNFLTSTYKKRYQYSSLSDIDFSSLEGQTVDVSLLGSARTDASAHLYEKTIDSAKSMIYPYSYIGNYKIDCVETARTPVFLRYNDTYTEIAISFDAKYFRALPYLHDVLSEPLLSEDGTCVIAFTLRGLAKCDIDTDSNYAWEISPYCELAPETFVIEEIRHNIRPKGVFVSRENFAYVLEVKANMLSGDDNRLLIYAEYIQNGERMYSMVDTLDEGISLSDLEDTNRKPKISFNAGVDREMTIVLELRNVWFSTNSYEWALFTISPQFYAKGSANAFSHKTAVSVADGVLVTANSDLVLADFIVESYAGSRNDVDGIYVRVRSAKKSSGVQTYLYLNEHLIFYGTSEVLVTTVTNDAWSYTGIIDPAGSFMFNASGSILVGTDRVIELNEEDHSQHPFVSYMPKTADKIVRNTDGYPWYLIDGELWTSKPTENNTLLIDLTVPGEYNFAVPDHWRELNEHYFAFSAKRTGENNHLEITQTRRNEAGKILFYLPEYNSQVLADKITNLWPLTDNIIGVFTEKELYYVNAITADDAQISYTKLMKSKTEIGCRDGDDIAIMQDGKTIILSTPRGIALMSASALVDTSTQSLSYLSDTIAPFYHDFYSEKVNLFTLDKFRGEPLFRKPSIKIFLHEHLVLFYRYLDNVILVFDTRNNSWWRWSTPYPIRQLMSTIEDDKYFLTASLQINFSPYRNGQKTCISDADNTLYIPTRLSTLGNEFLFDTSDQSKYTDDLIHKALVDGEVKIDASQRIDWYVKSQRLHFDAINNYKCVKSVGLMTKAEGPIRLSLMTKAYRDFYHPEYHETFEFDVNEQKTFFRKTNMMHLTNFQYQLSNADEEIDIPLKLNSICIKYEVKEAIR